MQLEVRVYTLSVAPLDSSARLTVSEMCLDVLAGQPPCRGMLADLRRRRGALDHGDRPVTRMPTVADMRSFGEGLLAKLEGDPADANTALRAAMPSPAVLVPGNDDAGPVLTMAGKANAPPSTPSVSLGQGL